MELKAFNKKSELTMEEVSLVIKKCDKEIAEMERYEKIKSAYEDEITIARCALNLEEATMAEKLAVSNLAQYMNPEQNEMIEKAIDSCLSKTVIKGNPVSEFFGLERKLFQNIVNKLYHYIQ